jgi:uncharacterized surface protein with fasciclin (FAS1) repeats
MRRIRAIALLVTVAAVAASAVAATASSAREAEPRPDVVAAATAAGSFTTLTKLLSRAGLVATLRQPGPYTVFAPTDAAFAKVPKKTLNAVLADRAKLRAVLLHHVVRGEVTAAKVVRLRSVRTVGGGTLRIRTAGSTVHVGGAKVTAADVRAGNGVVHVVDRVLIPPAA